MPTMSPTGRTDDPATLWKVNAMATYAAGPALSSLPKRERNGGRTFDKETANALLALVTASDGATATDGTYYDNVKAARVASNNARRMLARVAPEGMRPATRHDEATDGKHKGKWTWVLYLTKATPKAAPAADAPAAEA